MPKIVAWPLIGFVIAVFGVAFLWPRHSAESMPFPKGYLLQEKPSIFFNGHRGLFTDEFLYDLVIEDIVKFVVVRDRSRINVPDQPSNEAAYKMLIRGGSWAECLAADRSPQLRLFSSVWRSSFDLLRGRCVIVQPVEKNDSDLQMREDEDFWSFVERSTGKQIARAPKGSRREHVRALFGDRANISQQSGAPVFEDDFTDAELVRALEGGGHATKAAVTIIRLRTRLEDGGLVPEISLRGAISPEALERLLHLAAAGKDPVDRFVPGFLALIPGASTEMAETIYPAMVELLYAPFRASKPYGPWHYGNSWKEQIRGKRPDLEEVYASNDYVPVFAAADSFRAASALALQLGQPYVRSFYNEFRTQIVNRTLSNSGPSFHTTILAQSEPDLVGIISEIRSRKASPNRTATIWALIEQGNNLPEEFVEELRVGCNEDPGFLNDLHASHKYLNGETFCAHYFQAEGARYAE